MDQLNLDSVDVELVQILLRAIDTDEELQNNVPRIGPLSDGMLAALHGVWGGRAIWREHKQKKLEAEIERMKQNR